MEQDDNHWPLSVWGAAFVIGGAALATAGGATTLMYLNEGVKKMEGQHWVMLLVVLVAGYVVGRLWATPAQMVGLP